jgi:hypothetical protein
MKILNCTFYNVLRAIQYFHFFHKDITFAVVVVVVLMGFLEIDFAVVLSSLSSIPDKNGNHRKYFLL